MTARAELSSIATGLDELVGRIDTLLDSLGGAERDALGADLYELERSLDSARRQVGRIVERTA